MKMGWDGMPMHGSTIRAHINYVLGGTAIDMAFVDGVAYAACKHPVNDRIEGFVVLYEYGDADYEEIFTKEIHEACGPCESKCPDRILNLLTPTDCKWAIEWRTRCREYNKKVRK
jgi:hypothetical protein